MKQKREGAMFVRGLMNYIESFRLYIKGNYLNQELPNPDDQVPLHIAVDSAEF